MISVWLDGYPDDFCEPLTYPCLQKLIEFAEQHIDGSDLAHRAKHRLQKFIANDESSVRGIEGKFHHGPCRLRVSNSVRVD